VLWISLNRENKKKEKRAAAGEIADEGTVKNDEDVRWIFQT